MEYNKVAWWHAPAIPELVCVCRGGGGQEMDTESGIQDHPPYIEFKANQGYMRLYLKIANNEIKYI